MRDDRRNICPVCGEECEEVYLYMGGVIACDNCFEREVVKCVALDLDETGGWEDDDFV